MTFPVVLLWIDCLLFVGFGLGFVAAPQELAEFLLGSAPIVPSAVIDMRATYGGVALGIGLFFGLTARSPQTVRIGLLASLLVIGSLGAARLVGVVVDGEPNGFMLLSLATEAVSVGLTVAALRQLEHSAS